MIEIGFVKNEDSWVDYIKVKVLINVGDLFIILQSFFLPNLATLSIGCGLNTNLSPIYAFIVVIRSW